MSSSSEKSIAFIPPRYGEDVVGGAEAVIAEAAAGFAQRGYNVEILTTCAKDHYTWENEYPAGSFEENGYTVRRFLAEVTTAGKDREAIGGRILRGEKVSIEEQQVWVNDSLRSSDLWHYVSENNEKYRAFIFAPYMFWTTFAVGQIYQDKTIIMPCLHDEPPAYLPLFQPLMNGARGIWYLTQPEADLGAKIFECDAKNQIVGAAVDIPTSYDPDSFRSTYSIDTPYIYYAGRREWGKGWSELVDAFVDIVSSSLDSDLLLVTSGVGEVDVPDLVRDRVVDVGFLSEEERNNAMAGALVYIQPSALESFSRTVLEAWLAGSPVIANAQSDVVKWHVQRSQAGFCYTNRTELSEAILVLSENPEAAKKLASPGREYVLKHYTWNQVLDNMEESLDRWLPSDQGVRS